MKRYTNGDFETHFLNASKHWKTWKWKETDDWVEQVDKSKEKDKNKAKNKDKTDDTEN